MHSIDHKIKIIIHLFNHVTNIRDIITLLKTCKILYHNGSDYITGFVLHRVDQIRADKKLQIKENIDITKFYHYLSIDYYSKPNDAVKFISKCKNIKYLYLSLYNASISKHFYDISILQNIEILVIQDCENMDRYALKFLSKYKKLRELNFINCHNIAKITVQYIKNLIQLEKLSFVDCNNAPNTVIRYISTLSNLKELVIKNCNDIITSENIIYFENFKQLRHLTIIGKKTTFSEYYIRCYLEKINTLNSDNIHIL